MVLSRYVRGFEKGLVGRGWRLTNPPKQPKKLSSNVFFSPKGGIGKRGAEKRPESGVGRISSRQPPLSANPFSKLLSMRGLSEYSSVTRQLNITRTPS